MSLTSYIKEPDVLARIKPLRPNLPRKIGVPLRAEPRSKRYMLVGTAFDYLLRFEAQRRAPHAVAPRWVADYAPDIIWRKTERGGVGVDLLLDADPADHLPPEEVARRVRRILADAKAATAAYQRTAAPADAHRAELAGHALRLGKLDSVYRAMRLDPHFEQAAEEDVEDLLALLALVPWDQLLHPETLHLNPAFGASSSLVGGADTDLVAGGLMVDVKTTKSDTMEAASLDQLLGYFLLARHCRREGGTFPAIDRLGLYFARHGHLWIVDAAVWTAHPQFTEVEAWFIKRAAQPRRPATARPAGRPAMAPRAGMGILNLNEFPPHMTLGEAIRITEERRRQAQATPPAAPPAPAPGIPAAAAPAEPQPSPPPATPAGPPPRPRRP